MSAQLNKNKATNKPVRPSQGVRQESGREDPRLTERALQQLQVNHNNNRNRGYGMEYPNLDDDAAVIASAEACLARNSETPQVEIARFRKELLTLGDEDTSESETEFVCTPMAPELHTQRGACETLFMWMQRSQPYLIAMSQGLIARPDDAYPTTFVFDMDRDDLLKTCAQKALILPKLKILKEEVVRREEVMRKATGRKIKPMKKSASRVELLEWLKVNPVTDSLDEAFLYFEANKTYRMLMAQAETAAAAERDRLNNSNWHGPKPHLRLYHCTVDDEVIVLLRNKENVLTREELDARNSAERPQTYYQKVADLYNSNKVYITDCLPDLHSMFADPIELRFDDMPGGALTADDVKARLGDARAKMIMVSSKDLG
jgi:hypothetical protein